MATQAGIEVKAGFFLLWFTLFLFPPKISIDGGEPVSAQWGVNQLPTTPGRHTVTVQWLLYWFIPSNKATITVDVAEGQVAQIDYRPHITYLFFLPGRIQQTGTRSVVEVASAA